MIEPRNDYVLIERIEDPQAGVIYIPDAYKEKSMKGKVIAIGPGKMVEGINGGMVRRPIEVKIGDTVLFNSKWSDLAGSHYADDTPAHFDQKLHLVQEADILGWHDGINSAEIDRRRIGTSPNTRIGKDHQKRKAAQANSHGR